MLKSIGLPLGLVLMVVSLLSFAHAQEQRLRPFVLAWSDTGADLAGAAQRVQERLERQGFTVLGHYPVHAGAWVVVATSAEMIAVASAAERGAYAAVVRVSITQIGSQMQVSYTNPEYFRHAYRVEASMAPVLQKLEQGLGAQRHFGAAGLSPLELQRYRYAFGMERFSDPSPLAQHADRTIALAVIDANLRTESRGAREIYRLDLPERDATLIGLALSVVHGADPDADDAHQLATIDVGDPRHTAYLPYEILVRGGTVEALHMRFRMALHFPDLRMMGENSFVQLRRSPTAIEKTLTRIATR